MNKQILKFAKKSGATINEGFDGNKAFVYGITMSPEELEKFAELIVRECCDQLVKEGEAWEQFSRNPPEGQETNASAALFAAYRLKEDAVDMLEEHFGIEAPPVDNVDRILRTVRTRG